MEELLKTSMYTATLMTPIIMAVIELVKKKLGVEDDIPVIAVVIGISFGLLFSWYLGGDHFIYALAGMLSGLSSSGLYDLVEDVIDRIKGEGDE